MRNPRYRTIKPDLGDSRDIAKVSREARYFFVLLLCWLDDEGRAEWSPKLYSGLMYAHDEDVDAKAVTGWMQECTQAGLLIHYAVDGEEYIAAPNFTKHQKVERATPSEFPAPPTHRHLDEDSPKPQEPLGDDSPHPHRGLTEGSPTPHRHLDEDSPTREGVGVGEGKREGDKLASQPARGDHPADQHFEGFFRLPACQRARRTADDEPMLDGFRKAFDAIRPHVENSQDWPGWSDFLERFVESLVPDRSLGKNSVFAATPGMVLRERFGRFLASLPAPKSGPRPGAGIDWDAIAKGLEGEAA